MIDKSDCCDHGDNVNNQEVNIDYPCEWLYKVVGSDKGVSVHNVIAGTTVISCRTSRGIQQPVPHFFKRFDYSDRYP